jgi:hypothetical protein
VSRLAVIALVIALVLAVAGGYEWQQKVTCGAGASAKCSAGKRRHPRRAEALWGVAVVVALGAGGVMVAGGRK